MNPRYPSVAERAGHRCEYCLAPELTFNTPHEVEHVFPSAYGGDDSEQNLALACRACNLHKGTKTGDFDPISETSHRLFNPRSDRWDDHFIFDTGSAMIVGATPVGRATVAALRLNEGLQIPARRYWMLTNLYPPEGD